MRPDVLKIGIVRDKEDSYALKGNEEVLKGNEDMLKGKK